MSSGIAKTVGGLLGTAVGAFYGGPIGAMVGNKAGGALGEVGEELIGGEDVGKEFSFHEGGMVHKHYPSKCTACIDHHKGR